MTCKNREIRELYGRWKFNADLMTCQECGYSVIATRMHEKAGHAAGCKHEDERNPWLQLADLLQDLKSGEKSHNLKVTGAPHTDDGEGNDD